MKSDKKIKKFGQVFTPKVISKEMINLSDIEKDFNPEYKILEPSVGDGEFLFSILDFVINKIEKKSEIFKYIKNNIYVCEIDVDVIKQLIKRLENKLKTLFSNEEIKELANNIIISEDFLMFDFENKFDLIIGNPPYIRTKNINPMKLTEYRKNFFSMKKGNVDIFYGFIEKSFNLLTENGKVVFITPNTFMTNSTGEWLRKNIIFNHMKTFINFGSSTNPFNPKLTYTCITIIKKNNNNNKINFYSGAVHNHNIKKEKIVVSVYNDSYYYGEKPTLTNEHSEKDITFRYGLATLADDIFIFSKRKSIDGFFILKDGFKIEEKFVKKIYRGTSKNVEDFSYIIFPYKKNNGKIQPLTKEEISNKFPMAWSFLSQNKTKLLKRSIPNKDLWFLYGRSQGLELLDKEKYVLKSTITKTGIKFMKISKNTLIFSGIGVYGEMDKIGKLLSDDNFNEYLYASGQDRQGGYKMLSMKKINEYLSGKNN